MRYLTREETRKIDWRAIHEFGVPEIILMENAGRSVGEYLAALRVSSVVVCCGKGNNGGDGIVAARYLDQLSIDVTILLFADPDQLRGSNLINYKIAKQSGIKIIAVDEATIDKAEVVDSLRGSQWVVDALFGTGLQGRPDPFYEKSIRIINGVAQQILSIDIPSGLDCDKGIPLGEVIMACETLTIVGFKKGFAEDYAKKFIGKISLITAGFPRVLLEES